MINSLIGLLMGIANLIPGVSGGTIALVSGIYGRLMNSIATLTELKFKKKDLLFLFQLVAGIAVGIFAFSRLVEYSIDTFPIINIWFFRRACCWRNSKRIHKNRKVYSKKDYFPCCWSTFSAFVVALGKRSKCGLSCSFKPFNLSFTLRLAGRVCGGRIDDFTRTQWLFCAADNGRI